MIRLEIIRALRRLRETPRFSLSVVASIAIAVGPILVAFSVFDAAVLWHMAAKAPGHLLTIRSIRTGRRNTTITHGISFPDYQDLRRGLPNGASRYLTAWTTQDVNATLPGGDQSLRIAAAAGDYFAIANARFVRGHWPAEDESGLVVSEALWRELKTDHEAPELTIYDHRYRVTGVVNESFRGLYPNEGIDAWIPLSLLPRLTGDAGLLTYREFDNLSVVAAIPANSDGQLLRTSVIALSAPLAEFHEDRRYGWHLDVAPAQPGTLDQLRTLEGQAALAPLVVLLCVLVIAATNVANLFVVRTAGRQRNWHIRLALGIPRRYLLLDACIEPILLGAAGLLLGLGLGTVALHYVRAIPALQRLRLQSSVLSVSVGCGAAVLFAGLCALMPAMQVWRSRATDVVHQGHGITPHRVSRLQRVYLVLQFTLALAFTCVAVQLATAVRQESSVNVGFDTSRLLVVTGMRGAPGRSPQEWLDDYNRVALAVSSLPGVLGVSGSVAELFGGYGMSQRPLLTLPGNATASTSDGIVAGMDVVSPGHFATLGLPVRTGREFGSADRRDQPTRILVNQTLAKAIAGDRPPIGMTVYELGAYPLEVIGVVPDIRTTAAERVQPVYYRSLSQSPLPSFVLYVRVAATSSALTRAIIPAIVRELPQSGGRLRIYAAEAQRRERDLPAIAMFWLCTGLAIVALAVAGFGLYGVASHATIARTTEHAIRAALGASPRQLASVVIREGLSWTALAAAFSLPAVWVAMRVATVFVVGMRPVPVITTAAIFGTYMIVVVGALTAPAIRAGSVSPAEALRSV